MWDKTPGRFRNIVTGHCLAANGRAVFTMACTSTAAEWTVIGSTGKLIKHNASGGCLLGSGGSLTVGNCSLNAVWLV